MNQERKVSLDYAGMQGFYSMIYAGIGAFFSVFLLHNGFSNTEIGLVISCANLLTVIFSPSLADFADNSEKITLSQIIIAAACATAFMTFFLFILHGHTIALFIFYVMALAFDGFLQPLINTVSFEIEQKGIHINFGVCRSAGSICYAIMTAIAGAMIESAGILVIPASSLFSIACLLVSVFLLNRHLNGSSHVLIHNEKEKEEKINLKTFIQNNIPFLILNFGIVLLFYHSYVIGSFMLKIIEPLGGNAADMGRMFSLSAAVEVPAMMGFGLLNRKFSSAQLLRFSMTGFVVKTILLFTAQNLTMVYIAQSMQMFGYALFYPAMVRFIGERMKKGEEVKGQSLFTMMMTASGVIANFSGGVILDHAGIRLLLLICLVTAVCGASIIIVFSERVKADNNNTASVKEREYHEQIQA